MLKPHGTGIRRRRMTLIDLLLLLLVAGVCTCRREVTFFFHHPGPPPRATPGLDRARGLRLHSPRYSPDKTKSSCRARAPSVPRAEVQPTLLRLYDRHSPDEIRSRLFS